MRNPNGPSEFFKNLACFFLFWWEESLIRKTKMVIFVMKGALLLRIKKYCIEFRTWIIVSKWIINNLWKKYGTNKTHELSIFRYRIHIVIGSCILFFLLGLPMCTTGTIDRKSRLDFLFLKIELRYALSRCKEIGRV